MGFRTLLAVISDNSTREPFGSILGDRCHTLLVKLSGYVLGRAVIVTVSLMIVHKAVIRDDGQTIWTRLVLWIKGHKAYEETVVGWNPTCLDELVPLGRTWM